jgi:hypothetical protein
VITSEFPDAFERQCAALGFKGAAVIVPHPIQNRTTEELWELADRAYPEIVAALAADQPSMT